VEKDKEGVKPVTGYELRMKGPSLEG
jgi:hypothetical protein